MHQERSLWSSALRLIGSAEDAFTVERVRRKVARGSLEPVTLVPHRGHGTAAWLRLQVRVLESPGVTPGTAEDPWWRNVAAAYHRFVSTEIPGAVVRATVGGETHEAVAGVEGYAHFDLPNPTPDDIGWRTVDLELVGPLGAGQSSCRATAEVLVPDPRADIGIISDIDDTILHTGLTETAGMLRTTLLLNASTRVPYPGVSAFYRALTDGPDGVRRPIFYVSGSPWNLYDMIERFMQLRDIPRGPLFLKDWGIDEHKFIKEDTHAYKLARIGTLLEVYPDLRWVLIGDSGQHDPEIYADVVERWPERVAAIYIRDVTADADRDRAVTTLLRTLARHDVPAVLGESTFSAATDAARRGLIAHERLRSVREAGQRDRDVAATEVIH
jgi:phosphatidate phosphatase APP1